MKRVVLFVSGRGSNAEAIVNYAQATKAFQVVEIICDNPSAAVIDKAKLWNTNHGISLTLIPKERSDSTLDHDNKILARLFELKFDLIVLAGYRRLLSKHFLSQFPPRSIVNIHPSLLPDYPGLHSYERAFQDNVKQSGISIHFVDEGTDTGEMIEQISFSREPDDTLESFEERGLALEHQAYPKAIEKIFQKDFYYRLEVYPSYRALCADSRSLVAKVFFVHSQGPIARLKFIAEDVLIDPVVENVFVASGDGLKDQLQSLDLMSSSAVEVSFLPGVTDNTGNVAAKALMKHPELKARNIRVSAGRMTFLPGAKTTRLSEAETTDLQGRLYPEFANSWLERARVLSIQDLLNEERFCKSVFPTVRLKDPGVRVISLKESDSELEKINRENMWALSLDEIHFIRDHFSALKRDPTDVEMEIIAQTWSEHCKHKIFAAHISHEDHEGRREIKSLFKTFIQGATRKVEKERKIDWLRSVFTDNAGIVRWDENLDVCVKVETHNSPSALDPYGGALTGILGVNRDILGCGLGARPIANTDVFCLPLPQSTPEAEWPKDLLRPEKLREGVHRGVRDGGNKSGIPTVNGAFYYDDSYAGKPLVYCGTIGVLPREVNGRSSEEKNQKPGDWVVMVGGRIGKDGIHGATFSSLELQEGTPSTVVQIGDPLTQKRMTDFLLVARDRGLYTSITDNGAGGLSSSVGEMSQKTGGARIDLKLAPVKYQGLSPAELMISESQERMTCAVAPKDWPEFLKLAQSYDVEATPLGEFTDDGFLTVNYGPETVAKLSLAFLHEDLPPMKLQSRWDPDYQFSQWKETATRKPLLSLKQKLHAVLSSPNVRSHESWVRQYDHEVQAASVTKPFTPKGAPTDAAVIAMKPHGGGEKNGLAISCGLAPQISLQDTKLMAIYSIDEAIRNAVVVGANPEKMALVDNFCWPDPLMGPNNPDWQHKLAQLVRCNEGLYEAAVIFGMPFVSGKDSMKNDAIVQWRDQKMKISVLPTLLVTAIAHIEDVTRVVGTSYDKADDLWILGDLEGLYPYTLSQLQGNKADSFSGVWGTPDLQALKDQYQRFHRAVQEGLIVAAHDVSDGGLVSALVEMALASEFGCEVERHSETELFGEGPGLIIFASRAQDREKLQTLFPSLQRLGRVTEHPEIQIQGEFFSKEELKAFYLGAGGSL